eukprot:scaffold1884_cov343-Ochromonas_danica.AAC.9
MRAGTSLCGRSEAENLKLEILPSPLARDFVDWSASFRQKHVLDVFFDHYITSTTTTSSLTLTEEEEDRQQQTDSLLQCPTTTSCYEKVTKKRDQSLHALPGASWSKRLSSATSTTIYVMNIALGIQSPAIAAEALDHGNELLHVNPLFLDETSLQSLAKMVEVLKFRSDVAVTLLAIVIGGPFAIHAAIFLLERFNKNKTLHP